MLRDVCCKAVGKRILYAGTNGDEYDPLIFGQHVKGEGLCISQHDSHGLCIMVKHDDGTIICVDPTLVEIIDDYPLSSIPAWCQMPIDSHQDKIGGCWGIYHGKVAKQGETYCQTCEFCQKDL